MTFDEVVKRATEIQRGIAAYLARQEEKRICRLLGLPDGTPICPAVLAPKTSAPTGGEKVREDIQKMFGAGGDDWTAVQGSSDQQENVPTPVIAAKERAVSPTLAAAVAAYFGTPG